MSNKNKTFSFQEQLKVGDRGESLFMERYPRNLDIYPGREYDFTVRCNGKTVELKTDSFNMEKTPNFFLERYSDVYKKTPGGPWRAKKDKVDIFCYYFVRHNLWYEFRDLPKLIKKLDKLTEKKGMIHVKNRGWVTGGYTVPREELEEFFDIYEF
jgi:hypothetical protein